MTADEIAFIRTARGGGVPWQKIAKHIGRSVQDCRAAIGLPTYAKEAAHRPSMPWDVTQRSLFDGQPERDEVSSR